MRAKTGSYTNLAETIDVPLARHRRTAAVFDNLCAYAQVLREMGTRGDVPREIPWWLYGPLTDLDTSVQTR